MRETMMIRLEYKVNRKKYGRIGSPAKKAGSPYNPRHKYGESKYLCDLSILHDMNRAEIWARLIKDEMNFYDKL